MYGKELKWQGFSEKSLTCKDLLVNHTLAGNLIMYYGQDLELRASLVELHSLILSSSYLILCGVILVDSGGKHRRELILE